MSPPRAAPRQTPGPPGRRRCWRVARCPAVGLGGQEGFASLRSYCRPDNESSARCGDTCPRGRAVDDALEARGGPAPPRGGLSPRCSPSRFLSLRRERAVQTPRDTQNVLTDRARDGRGFRSAGPSVQCFGSLKSHREL